MRRILAIVAGYLAMATPVALFSGWQYYSKSPLTYGYAYISIVVGLLGALAGGYVCAFVARQAEIVHATILVGISLFLGILTIAVMPGEPGWYIAANFAILVGGVYAGTFLRLRQKPLAPAG